MKQVIVGEHKKVVEILPDGLFSIDGKSQKMDIEDLGDGHFSVIRNHKNYHLEILKVNREEKTMTLKINDKVQEIKVKDKYDMLLDSLGMSRGADKKIKELKAPMPGLVLEVLAENDKSMVKGSTLLILEAMKMENIIKSPDEVVIEKIHVKAGESVEKNQVLVTFG